MLRATSGDIRAVEAIESLRNDVAHILATRVRPERPVIAQWPQLIDYLRFDMGGLPIERVRALYLDSRNGLICDRLVSEGTIDTAQLHAREVIVGALEVGAAAVILVHNHPSGDPTPSHADIEITRAIADAGKRLNIALFDHVVVAASGMVSMRAGGHV